MSEAGYCIDVTSGTAFYDFSSIVFEPKIIPFNLIEEVLPPIIITHICCNDKTLTFKMPIIIRVVKESFDNELAYTAVNKEFYIDIYDDSIENLKLAVKENICFLWETYAEAEDSCLTDGAIEIKNKLLSAITVS